QAAGRHNLPSFPPKFPQLNDHLLFPQVSSTQSQLSPYKTTLITITPLITPPNFQQLTPHLKIAKQNALTKQELPQIITHLSF
ncbi:carboxymuconolactone decarboxylase family protein, partial [Staphylococcus saprophyticus]|uniref:carboxymuconolactone decarboxylase family protein n=1 Tax=Staphylococcus saprophyticus TaxID=29385 RepID=UPI0011A9C122